MAFMAVVMGLGQLFYILFGFRYCFLGSSLKAFLGLGLRLCRAFRLSTAVRLLRFQFVQLWSLGLLC